MDMVTLVQIVDKVIYISHTTNILGKGINQSIFLSAMDKIVAQTGFFCLGMAASLGEGKFWSKIY